MRNFTATILLLIALVGTSCGSNTPGIFRKKTLHEKYADKLDKDDLDKTPRGRQWLAAAKQALEEPQTVTLPYKQIGYFQLDKPRALGLAFNAKRGEKLLFNLNKKTTANFVVYADLFKQDGTQTSHILSADTNNSQFSLDIDEAGSYVLRLQPELERTGEYNLSISVGSILAFPVSGSKAKTGSFWGASRDGGKRSHEGIDIFAPKLTPAVAAADGVVTGVKEGGIGGKVVWLRPAGKNYTLYYAHLDKQLVQEGQEVKKGETIGLVGNTGNAKHTPSHLHFGIYTSTGPVDPFPFVNQSVKTPAAVPEKNLNTYLRLTKAQKNSIDGQMVKPNTVIVPLAVTASGYIAELPDGKKIQTPFTSVQLVKKVEGPAVASDLPAREKGRRSQRG